MELKQSQDNFWQGKKVMVGGGCGFLGSYLTPQLVSAGARVMVVDNLGSGSLLDLKKQRV